MALVLVDSDVDVDVDSDADVDVDTDVLDEGAASLKQAVSSLLSIVSFKK